MSRYEFVETAIWSDPVYEALGPHAKLVYLWSFTNPRCNLPGIYKVTLRQISTETGIRPRRVEEALEELEAARLLYFDGTFIFVRSRVKYLHTTSSRTMKGIARDLSNLDERHQYVQAFLFMYQEEEWFDEVLGDLSTPASNPLMAVTQ